MGSWLADGTGTFHISGIYEQQLSFALEELLDSQFISKT